MEWDPALYVSKHSFVFESGRETLAMLAPQPGERILDLGCGTGQLTQAIAEAGADVTGLDGSPEMIEAARRRFPNLALVLADAADFDFPERFDAVFSNAVLHWMKEPVRVVERISRSLRHGGRFAVQLAGKGHLTLFRQAGEAAWREATGRDLPWSLYLPSLAEFCGLLEQAGLEVREARLSDAFTRLEDGENGLRNFMMMFGGERLRSAPQAIREKLVRRTEEYARPSLFRDGSWHLDRRRIFALAVKRSP